MTDAPPLTTRPLIFTAVPDAWATVLRALGGATLVHDGDWHVLRFGSGRVAVHGVPDGDPLAGAQRLGFETPDLAATAAALGLPVVAEDHGRAVRVVGPDGLAFLVDAETPAPAAGDAARTSEPPEPTAVLPLWYSPDVAGAAAALEGLGLRRRIESDGGGWVDLVAPGGGLHAAHEHAAPGVQVSFEHPDVRALADRLSQAGVAATVVDEAYGYSLRIPNPDAAAGAPALLAGAEEIWVNQTQDDLYGYRRA